ncbi:hypothetical protein ACOME3_000221 [Neoechinorhynchus agilis]
MANEIQQNKISLSSICHHFLDNPNTCTVTFEAGKQPELKKIMVCIHKMLYSKVNAARSASAVPWNTYQSTSSEGTLSAKLYCGWLKAPKMDCVNQLGVVPELHEEYVTSSINVRFQPDLIPKAIGDFVKGRSGLMEGAEEPWSMKNDCPSIDGNEILKSIDKMLLCTSSSQSSDSENDSELEDPDECEALKNLLESLSVANESYTVNPVSTMLSSMGLYVSEDEEDD